nr:PREDICTED: bridging integrator 3 isoform X2 [Struthio camelus australis]
MNRPIDARPFPRPRASGASCLSEGNHCPGGFAPLPGRQSEKRPAVDTASAPLRCWRSGIPFKIGQPKKQIVPKTVERDFEREYGKLQQLEDQTKKLQKDMKKSTDADLAMSKSAVKISSDLLSNPLCEQDPVFLEMVTAFDTAMKRMDSFNQEKVNQIQKTVIEPLKKFSSVFPSLNMAVKRREQTLQDYKRLQSKVEKYEEKEKTGPVLAKLHQAREELRPVKEDFEAKNKQLLEEMPKFYSSRIDYFKPSFESLVRAQVRCA